MIPSASATPSIDPLNIELWQNISYDDAFQQDLASAMLYHDDSSCQLVPPEYLAGNLIFSFDYTTYDENSITLYGKNLVCDITRCDYPFSVLLLEDMSCADKRNAFCIHPTRLPFVEVDLLRQSEGEQGCLFTSECARTSGTFCHKRFVFALDLAAVEPGRDLELCGIKVEMNSLP